MARRKQGWQAWAARFCPSCGRELQQEEACECADKLPRDGLRAACPHFRARSSYRGKHYIDCRGKYRFASKEARDAHYMACCCGDCGTCEINIREDTRR